MAQTYAPYSQSRIPPKPIQQNYQNPTYYDNAEANVPQTDVSANSPTLPTAPNSYNAYNSYVSANNSNTSYPAQTHYGYTQQVSQIPDDGHMSAYVPNVASQFPHSDNQSQTVPTYANGIAPGQSWARPADPQMNYPPPAEPIQSPVVAGQQAFGRNDHPGQGVTHFGINPPTESNIKVEPATQGSDFSVGHDSFSQASHGNVPAAYGHPNQGYGHGYDASLQHQQQAFHGHGTYSGVSQNSQQHFYQQNHHGHVYNNNYQPYQHSPQQQQQHPAPPSNDYAPPQPTYGVYDPHRHDEDQQLAHEAPYEEYEQYEEPLMKDVERGELMLNTPPEFVRPSALEGRSAATPEQFSNHGSPGVATSTRESGYGQVSHDDTFQAANQVGHGAHPHGNYMHHHRQASQSHASNAMDAQSPHHAQPAPTAPVLRYPDGNSPSDAEEESSESKMSPEEHAQRCQTVSYQRHLQERQFKRQRSAQFEEFEANHRPRLNSYQLDADYAYSVAQSNIPHHHHPAHHHRQSSSSSSHSDQSGRMPVAVPPVVPSQAYERPMPVPLIPSLEPEKKDPPPKKPALACLFCRKRKIACGPPPPDRQDKTCNQCVRRKQPCEYPTESRRGIRKTPKENTIEEPTVHKFVHGDPSSHDGSAAGRGKARRKRSLDE